MRPGCRHQPGVTVGRGFRRERVARGAARARTIVDDDGLAEFFRHRLREHARRDVGAAARGEAYQQAYRFGRKWLRFNLGKRNI